VLRHVPVEAAYPAEQRRDAREQLDGFEVFHAPSLALA
jgi:hypothetical protein